MRLRSSITELVQLLISLAVALPADLGFKINIGSTYGPDAPVHFGQVKFKELVEQRSKGTWRC